MLRSALLSLSLALVALTAPACHGPHHRADHHRADHRCADHRDVAHADVDTAADVTAELRATLDAFLAAERTRDVDALLAFLAPDFHMFQDGVRVDHDATVAQMRATLPTLRAFRPRFDDVRVIPISCGWALSSFVFHDEIVGADGSELALWGPSTMLWRRDDGRWRMVFADSDHYPEP